MTNPSPKLSAESITNTFWPSERFPVDPVTIARKLGLQVLDTILPGDVSGALIKEPGKDPVIAIHHSDSDNRKRFSCAHELGHYILRLETNKLESVYEYIDFRNAASGNGCDEEEIFANNFAANLLMPEKSVRELHKLQKSHYGMAQYFGVSNEAMNYRLNNLGL